LAVLELTADEREALQGLARRPKTAQALALRARIVLACAGGLSNSEVSRQIGVSLPTVGKWRKRFVDGRVDGLRDESRPGAPRKITDAQIETVIVTTLEHAPANNDSHWSTRSMAKAVGLNQTAVSRIWRAFGLKPHLVDTWKLSTDPLFIDKVRDIVGFVSGSPTGGDGARGRREVPDPGVGPYRADASDDARRPGAQPMTTSGTAPRVCSPHSTWPPAR
jgi:transposase